MDRLLDGASGVWLKRFVLAVVVLLALFLGIKALAEFQGLRYIGAGVAPANTISVSGYGEFYGVPDIATFTYSVVSEKSTVAAAQQDATTKANAITAYVKEAGIEEKDIQTTNYSINPQYDYVQDACRGGVCPGGRQVLRGYEVRQSTTIKVRDTDKAGELLAGVGSRGATEVSGLQFTFDDPNAPQEGARDKAIADAKAKGGKLAKSLGVSIVRVVSFSESGGGAPPMPYAYDSLGKGAATAQSAPEISIGENKITSTVSIVYEIR